MGRYLWSLLCLASESVVAEARRDAFLSAWIAVQINRETEVAEVAEIEATGRFDFLSFKPFLADCKTSFSRILKTFFYAILKFLKT